MTYTALSRNAARHGLMIYGGFHGDETDGLPQNHQTLLLLGPAPDFWHHFQTGPEAADTRPDPIDRWSTRTLTELAQSANATAFFPFGGPPYAPFLTWALKTNRCWSSPVGMLVHDTTGLMVSFRGALAFKNRLALPQTGPNPCAICTTKACQSACPVNALSATTGYDTAACHDHLNTPHGVPCLTQGCIARRVCPISAGANRAHAQSAHHMSYFHKKASPL